MSHSPASNVSVRLDGDVARAQELLPQALQLLSRVRAFCETSGVPTFSLHANPTPDDFLYAVVAGSTQGVIISAGTPEAPPPYQPTTGEGEPELDIMSGAVWDGRLLTEEYTDENGERKERRYLVEWSPTERYAEHVQMRPGLQRSERLAVEVPDGFEEWKPKPPSRIVLTQYQRARSSLYSGAMGKVVQALLGFGRVDPAVFAQSDVELEKPSDYMKKVAAKGVQILYDYKFNRTHGVYTAGDGTRWLLEISSGKGLVAIPLPMVRGTTADGFAERYRNSKYQAVAKIVEELGGVPSGEPMPSKAEIDRRVADGTALQLLTPAQVGPFYELSGFSSNCGWSFNSQGNMAVNVGYRYDDDHPYQRSQCWQIRIRIGNLRRERQPGEPIAHGSATIRMMYEGRLFSHKRGIPVKYHEPALDGLMTHIALPQRMGTLPLMRMNAPVFAAFINDDIKIGWFFNDQRSKTTTEGFDEREGEECFLSGTWSWARYTGSTGLPPMVHTNDLDFREVAKESFVEGTMTAKPVGWDPPSHGHNPVQPAWGSISVSKVFQRVTKETSGGFETRGSQLIVPDGVRNGYCFYQGHWWQAGKRTMESSSATNVNSPKYGITWRQWPRWDPDRPGPVMTCGGKHSDSRIVEIVDNYSEHDCSRYAEGGPLPGMCASVDRYNQPGNRIRVEQYQRTTDSGTDFKGTVNVVLDTVQGIQSMPIGWNDMTYAMVPSPSELGTIQGMQWAYSTLGHRVTYSMGFLEGRSEGATPFAVPQRARIPTYIGVIE